MAVPARPHLIGITNQKLRKYAVSRRAAVMIRPTVASDRPVASIISLSGMRSAPAHNTYHLRMSPDWLDLVFSPRRSRRCALGNYPNRDLLPEQRGGDRDRRIRRPWQIWAYAEHPLSIP